jgi:glycosyltransferase involved in cell wall biosynthesis
MKICYVGTGTQSIGYDSETAVELVIHNLSSEMERLGEKVHIIDIFDEKRKRDPKIKYEFIKLPIFKDNKYTKAGGLIHILKKIIFSLKVLKVLKKTNKKENFNVIHIQNQYTGFFILLFRRFLGKYPIVYTSHTPFWTLEKKEFNKNYYFKTFLERLCIKMADKVITVGSTQKKGILEKIKINPEKIISLPNGVDLDKFKPGKENNKKTIFLTVGKIENRKNQLEIIKSITNIKDKDFEFWFIGQIQEKEYYEEIEKQIKKDKLEEYVKILGTIKNNILPEYYSKSDVYISSSTSEGFPLTVLEAMASGCAVILSDIGPHKEMQKQNEIIYFNLHDQKDLEEKITKISKDKKELERLKKLSLDTARKYYSWRNVAKNNLDVYKKLIG